jgi:hypothetical protein
VRAYDSDNAEKTELTCAGIELSHKNCKITVFIKEITKDSAGFGKESFKEITELYAYKEERPGSEQHGVSGTFPKRPVIFRLEKPIFILTTDYYIQLDNELYDIQSVIEVIGREEFIEVHTVSRGLYGR